MGYLEIIKYMFKLIMYEKIYVIIVLYINYIIV